jgi:hypothetical protein
LALLINYVDEMLPVTRWVAWLVAWMLWTVVAASSAAASTAMALSTTNDAQEIISFCGSNLTFQNRNMKLVPSVDTGYLYKDRWID